VAEKVLIKKLNEFVLSSFDSDLVERLWSYLIISILLEVEVIISFPAFSNDHQQMEIRCWASIGGR
jgi:hypothetical protein